MAFWGKRPVKKNPEIIVLGDGVNTYNSIFNIKKSEAVSSLNTSNRKYPALSVRPGMTSMYNTAGCPLSSINGVGVRNGTIPHFQNGTAWQYWNSATSALVDVVASGGLTNAKAKIFEFSDASKRYTILVNGTNKKYWDGSGPAVDMTDAPATVLYTADDYKIYALVDSLLKFSANGSVTDWTTVDNAGEEPISGMVGTGTALIAFGDMKIAWSDQTMHIMYGNTIDEFSIYNPIACGNISDRATIINNGVLYFMDYKQFKAFTGGLPFDVSQKAKTYLEAINYSYKQNICAGKWGKYIYLSFPWNGSNTNNLTLEFDTAENKWYPWDIGFVNFFNMGEDLYGITTGGIVYKLQQGTADDSNAISWSHITGPWYAAPASQKKSMSKFYATIDLPSGSSLNISYSTVAEGSTFTSLYDFTASSDIQNQKIYIPTAMLAEFNMCRFKFSGTGPCDIYFVEDDVRIKPR